MNEHTGIADRNVQYRRDIASIIALWLAIHGGDPSPEELSPSSQLVILQSLRDLAGGLSDAGVRNEVQSVTSKAMASVAQQMIRR